MIHLIKEKENRGKRFGNYERKNVKKCIYKGLSVIEGNAETELHQFPTKFLTSLY